MGKLQVPLADELIFAAKTHALRNGTTLREVVRKALETYLGQPSPDLAPKLQPKKTEAPKPKEYPADDFYGNTDDYYILRKTKKEGKPLTTYTRFSDGHVEWFIGPECKAHYDADNQPIPFRLTDWDGNILEPDKDELRTLEQAYGKPVKIEK